MAQPLRNPFYVLLLTGCFALLVTMLIYTFGWPGGPSETSPMPPWMQWVDRNAIWLIAVEVGAVVLLAILTIGFDKYFEGRNQPPPETKE